MKYLSKALTILILSILTACGGNTTNPEKEMKTALKYPDTRKDTTVVEDYFGTKVADPFRWLEDDLSEETANWVKNQNKVTFDYLETLPMRDSLKERLTELWNYEKVSAPFKAGENYFFYKNNGLQNQSVLYKQKGLKGEAIVFLDPNTLSEDGTTSLNSFSISTDNKTVAYGVSEGGSDWVKIKVKDIETGKDSKDIIDFVKFSGASWYKDGFFYSRFPATKENGSELSAQNSNQQVYYHQLGTTQDKDLLIFEDKSKPLYYNFCGVTDDERFLFIIQSSGTSGNSLMVRDLTKGFKSPLKKVADGFANDHSIVGNIGEDLYIYTNLNANNYKLVKVNAANPSSSNWMDVLPNSADMILNGVNLVGGKIIANYGKDVSDKVITYTKTGVKLSEVELPGKGNVSGFGGKWADKETFYTFTNYVYPPTIFKYDIETGTSEMFKKSGANFNPENFVSEQVWYTSKDGTKVPMYITHKKGLKKDGSNPTLLYGYGGFNINIEPGFSISRAVFLENGGIYAVANLRGGNEFGEDWHKGGMLEKKQNVFDDFIAAGEYLVKEKYTTSKNLGIMGRSNGGLLVGACMAQRPDLFAVAFPGVGVLDMLRFHKFTVGHGWVVEYGSSDNEKDFDYLYKYSPLHNLKAGTNYPATMITTADHDDRVVPAHSFKFAAELQDKHKGNNPVLIRIDTQAGHGAGKSTEMQIQEWADVWAFMFANTETGMRNTP